MFLRRLAAEKNKKHTQKTKKRIQSEYKEKFVEWPLEKENRPSFSQTNPLGLSRESMDTSTWRSESHVATENMLTLSSSPAMTRPPAGVREGLTARELAATGASPSRSFAQGKGVFNLTQDESYYTCNSDVGTEEDSCSVQSSLINSEENFEPLVPPNKCRAEGPFIRP